MTEARCQSGSASTQQQGATGFASAEILPVQKFCQCHPSPRPLTILQRFQQLIGSFQQRITRPPRCRWRGGIVGIEQRITVLAPHRAPRYSMRICRRRPQVGHSRRKKVARDMGRSPTFDGHPADMIQPLSVENRSPVRNQLCVFRHHTAGLIGNPNSLRTGLPPLCDYNGGPQRSIWANRSDWDISSGAVLRPVPRLAGANARNGREPRPTPCRYMQ